MKILFLAPPTKGDYTPPLGIAYITSVLNENGHKAIIKEGVNKSFRELVRSVKQINPEIVGITMNTTNRFACLKLAKEIKQRYGLPIILGGPHATFMTDQILRNYPFVDYIIRNEGEYTCLNLLNELERGKGEMKSLKKIKGISYREGKKIIHNEQADFITDLDSLPYPEYKFFNLDEYRKLPEHPKEFLKYPAGSIIPTRGCPHKCTFCSTSEFWGHNIRFRKPESILEEIEHLYSKYNTRYIIFNDDNFTINRKRAIDFCKLMVKSGLSDKVKWNCLSEIGTVNKELITWLKKANCNMIGYGMEDVSPEGLSFFKKHHTLKQAFKTFKLTNDAGIKIRSYFIVGGDHETLQNIKLKKKIIEKLNPTETTASLLLAYPRTRIFEIGKERGYWDESVWLKPCTGKNFHNYVPILPSKHVSLKELFAASADIEFWWNRKKGYFDLRNRVNTAVDLLKCKDFLKIYVMGKAILLRSLKI